MMDYDKREMEQEKQRLEKEQARLEADEKAYEEWIETEYPNYCDDED